MGSFTVKTTMLELALIDINQPSDSLIFLEMSILKSRSKFVEWAIVSSCYQELVLIRGNLVAPRCP